MKALLSLRGLVSAKIMWIALALALPLAAWDVYTAYSSVLHFAQGKGGYGYFSASPFIVSSLLLIWAARDTRWRIATAAAVLTAELSRAMLLVPHMSVAQAFYQGCGMAAGFVAAVMALAQCFWLWKTNRRDDASTLFSMWFWTALIRLGAHHSLAMIIPFTVVQYNYDAEIYLIDRALGFDAAQWFGILMHEHPWLAWPVWRVYGALPGALVLVYWLEVRRNPRVRTHVLCTSVFASLWTWLYVIVPACGPAYTFKKDYPFALPTVEQVLERLPLIKGYEQWYTHNAMPSFHFLWVLLLVFHARPLGYVARAACWIFMALTFIATLGTGHHYLLDLIVSLPFAVAAYAAVSAAPPDAKRWMAVSGGFVLGMSWLLIIRYHASVLYESGWLAWGAVCVTLAASLWLKYRYDRRFI